MNRRSLIMITCILTNVMTIPSVTASMDKTPPYRSAIGNDEQEFTFTGKCPNGDKYRLFSYQMDVDGLTQSFYDYEGPAGKGTVRTNVPPKKMVVRVCHELADIGHGSRFN